MGFGSKIGIGISSALGDDEDQSKKDESVTGNGTVNG